MLQRYNQGWDFMDESSDGEYVEYTDAIAEIRKAYIAGRQDGVQQHNSLQMGGYKPTEKYADDYIKRIDEVIK